MPAELNQEFVVDVDSINRPHPKYAGLVRRVAARLVDALAIVVPVVLAGLILRGLLAIGIWQSFPEGVDMAIVWERLGLFQRVLIFIAFLVSSGPIYYVLFESSSWQATLGKRLLSIFVTDQQERRITAARACGRLLAHSINFMWLILAISIITILVSPTHQAVHDFLAKTLVVRGSPPSGQIERWRIVASFGVPVVWVVVTFLVTL